MATHTADTTLHPPHHPFADRAFDPELGYDFDDEAAPANMDHSMTMLNGLGGQTPYLGMMNSFCDIGDQGTMFTNSIHGDSWPNPRSGSTFPAHSHPSDHSMDPSDVWGASRKPSPSMLNSGLPYPPSAQTDIIKTRGGTVRESYGNLTPPEDALADGVSSTKTKPALNRSERARNAAVQRHAKTKKRGSRKEVKKSESELDDSGDDGVKDKRERYREKNRAAAAKCRAKKKTHTEQIELDARALETDNTLLKAKVRELRNQHSELRNMALQHNAGEQNCQCGAIHQYNLGKAAEITSSFSRFAPPAYNQRNSDGMASNVPSPTAKGSHRRCDSYATSSGMSLPGMNSPENMQMQRDEDPFPDSMPNSERRSTFAG